MPSFAMQTITSTVNIENVEALKKLMRDTYTHFSMHDFLWTDTKNCGDIISELRDPACGTVACIAGYAAVLHLSPSSSKPGTTSALINLALKYLGVSKKPFKAAGLDEESLFYSVCWPHELYLRYNHAIDKGNPAEAVEVACEAIDRYIAQYQEAELAYAAIGGAL